MPGLAHLNGHFGGNAAGERFRRKGKTDICIEFEHRAAFVAECKLWKGPKAFGEAIDQLLGYLMSRRTIFLKSRKRSSWVRELSGKSRTSP